MQKAAPHPSCAQVEQKIFEAQEAAKVTLLGATRQVRGVLAVTKVMLQVWRTSNFKQRRLLISILLKYITEHQDEICRCVRRACACRGSSCMSCKDAPAVSKIADLGLKTRTAICAPLTGEPASCRVSALDSGKPMVDAAFGEVMVTCEKAVWLLKEGERWLRPESRSAGRMVSVCLCTVFLH